MSLRARLLLAIAYPLVVAIVALAVPLTSNLHERVEAEVREQAGAQASILAASVPALEDAELRTLVREGARRAAGRVVVVDGRGRVLVDSAGTAEVGTPFAGRPEIARAIRGERVQNERRSETLDAEILTTAVPVVRDGRTVGAVRVTQAQTAVADATRRATTGIGAVSGIVLLVGLLLAAGLAAQLARPTRRLQAAAQRLATGDLASRAPVEGATEQRRTALAFNDMAVRLGRLLDAQRAFVADASHQLRTPLTGMRLRLEELRHLEDPRAVAGEADAAIAELDRLTRIVDELLVLSQAGERDAPVERLDLRALLAAAEDRWTATAADRGVRLQTAEPPGDAPLEVVAAEPDVERAIDALIENALAYGAAGGELVLRASPGRFEVLDAGPGPAAGEEELVFERFHRGHEAASAPGTGLGLAIVRELAGRWGGTATLARRGPDGGARATLEFPRP